VAFLDDDAYATKRWLELLAQPFSDDDVAGVGGPAWPIWEGGRPSWFPPEFEWVVGCTDGGMAFGQNDVRNLWGVNMSFRRDLLLMIGGFRIGIYCDETELCIRLRQRWPGKRLVLLPEARVLHHVVKSRTTVRHFLTRCYYEGGSKALLSRLLGARDALSSERRYAWKILPRGVGRGIADFALDHDPHGLARAGLIVGGLATTTAGYAVGHLMPNRTARRRGWNGELGGRPSSQPRGDGSEGAR
jgi:hypothetical protein